MAKALDEIESGKSGYAAAKKYKIPYSTIKDNVNKKYETNKIGHPSAFTEEEEKTIENWVIYMADRGFPVNSTMLLEGIAPMLESIKKKGRLSDWTPGIFEK